MKTVKVVYDTRGKKFKSRVLQPLESLALENKIELDIKHVSKVSSFSFCAGDVLVLQDSLNPAFLSLLEGLRGTDIRVVYDFTSTFGEARDEDVRALSTRYNILRNCDLCLRVDEHVIPEWSSLSVHQERNSEMTSEDWLVSLAKVNSSPRRISEDAQQKHIFVISPTHLWPHQYISDMCTRIDEVRFSSQFVYARNNKVS